MIQDFAYQGLATFAKLFAGKNPDELRVLMYHRVDEPTAKKHLANCTLSATPENFRLQIEFLRKHHSIVSIADVVDALDNGSRLPPRAVLLTFDDAYQCFGKNAWPVLKEHDLPSILFVPTGFPDNRNEHFWWDIIHRLVHSPERKILLTDDDEFPLDSMPNRSAAETHLTDQFGKLPANAANRLVQSMMELNQLAVDENDVMSWETIRKLTKQGLDLGAHSQTHPLLGNAPQSDSLEEIAGSVNDIERETGERPQAFAYPGGSFNDATIENCRSAGIKIAFTTCRGSNNLKTVDPYKLRRINVGRRATLPKLQTQLLMRESWMNFLFRETVTARSL